MATDSSSGTLPSSRRLTIDSSSSIARSNGNRATSTLFFCAIAALLLGKPLDRSAFAMAAPLAPHQRLHLAGDRIAERPQIITTLEQRDDVAAGPLVGDVHELLRHPDEVGFGEIDVGERIARVGVEAGRDDNEFGPKVAQPRQDACRKRGVE